MSLDFRKGRLASSHSHNQWLEQQTEELKYQFLASNTEKMLGGMLTVLIEDFLPNKYTR